MSSSQIILFDLPSRTPCKTWSVNPWKTRLILNYKGLDYKTEWTEYPDIRPKFEPHLPPNDDGTPYTIPTIKLPDGTYIMDSVKIAPVLEALRPEPSLHLDSPYLAKVLALYKDSFASLRHNLFTRIPKNLLNDASVPHWRTTREAALGTTLEDHERQYAGEKSLAAAEPYLRQVTALLRENEDGPFFLGKEPSYADFVWVATLVFFRRVDEAIFEAVLKRTGGEALHRALVDACAPWLERDDH